MTVAVTEYRAGGTQFNAAMNARVVDTKNGEIVWANEDIFSVPVGMADEHAFDNALKPLIQKLASSLKAADIGLSFSPTR